jgi:hypothetical protein
MCRPCYAFEITLKRAADGVDFFRRKASYRGKPFGGRVAFAGWAVSRSGCQASASFEATELLLSLSFLHEQRARRRSSSFSAS